MRPELFFVCLVIIMPILPNVTAEWNCQDYDDPVEEVLCEIDDLDPTKLICIGVIDLPNLESIDEDVRQLGFGPFWELDESRSAGLAIANDGTRSFGGHTSFVLIGATRNLDLCSDPYGQIDQLGTVASYWGTHPIVETLWNIIIGTVTDICTTCP